MIYLTIAMTIIMIPSAWFLNAEIGDGEYGLVKHRWPVFVAWGVLSALLSYSLYGMTYTALYCTLFAATGYLLFRQSMSPTPAFFAGHGSTNKVFISRTNAVVEWLSIKLFNLSRNDIYLSRNASVEYGLKVGGIVGFCKSFLGWGIFGSIYISPICLILPALGMLYGVIHWYWGQYKKGIIYNLFAESGFRGMSEKTAGALIIAPNTIIPIIWYNGGLLNLIN